MLKRLVQVQRLGLFYRFLEAEQSILLLLNNCIDLLPNPTCSLFILFRFHKPIRESARKERDMKDYLFGLMMVVLPIGAFFYVLFNGYPSLFASVIIGAVMGICFLKEVAK